MYALLGRVTRCLDARGCINKAKHAATPSLSEITPAVASTALITSDHVDSVQKCSDLHLTICV